MSNVLPINPPAQPVLSGKATSTPALGAIPGGLLRPGAIDQEAFKAALARAKAGEQIQKAPDPLPGKGVVTLTPEQFQALTGAQITRPADPAIPAQPQTLDSPVENVAAAEPNGAPAAPVTKPEREDDVLILHRLPDKDERDMLRGKQWRIVEDPRARELYFGPDGDFGFDDFIDLINPLQHIPIVSTIYRELTGDQIAGAPQLLGSIIFGPVSVVATIADLMVKSTTGNGIAENAIAMVTGTNSNSLGSALQEAQLPPEQNYTADVRGTRRS